MKTRFYVGLVSISFVAPAWGMHGMDYDALSGLRRSGSGDIVARHLLPIDIKKHYGAPIMLAPLSRSAPATPSLVPEAPAPKNTSAEEPTKSLGKKRDSGSPRVKSAPTIRESAILQKLAAAEDTKKQAALRAALAQAKTSLDLCSELVEQAFNADQSEKPEQKS